MTEPITPPAARTALGEQATQAYQPGQLILQCCQQCQCVQYPHRDICVQCLSDDLVWQRQKTGGVVCAGSLLHRSLEPFFQQRSPWLIGSVKMDCGPLMLAHLADGCQYAGSRVNVIQHLDASQQCVLVALPQTSSIDMPEAMQQRLGILPHSGEGDE